MTFDTARAAFPHLGLSLYAYEPGAPVVLEVHTPEGDFFTFQGPTAEAVLTSAFPDAPEAEEDDVFG